MRHLGVVNAPFTLSKCTVYAAVCAVSPVGIGVSRFLRRKADFLNRFLRVMAALFLAFRKIRTTFAPPVAKKTALFDLVSCSTALLHPSYHPDAYLIEQIKWNRYEY